MGNTELVTPVLVTAAYHPVLAIAPDADIDMRWAAWAARGRAHEQRVRHRLVVTAGVLVIGAAIAYGLLRS
jgi:hypothetical protein